MLLKFSSLLTVAEDIIIIYYEYGWAGSFHFLWFFKGEGFAASLARPRHAFMNITSPHKGLSDRA